MASKFVAYQQAADEHRRALARIAERHGAERLRRHYESAVRELEEKLRRLVVKGRGNEFTAHQHRIVLYQLKQGVADLSKDMAGELQGVTHEAQVESLRFLNENIARLEKQFTGAEIVVPTEEPATFLGVIERNASSLLRMHEESMARYGGELVGKMEEQLAMSLTQGETMSDAIDRVQDVAGNEWWQAERIVRTETSYAFNLTHADGIEAAATELPDLMMRWSEHVDDETGEPLDDRVAPDSLAMHGQVTRPGAGFFVPPDERIDPRYWNTVITTLPLRPNGREVLEPWRPGWGIPGWQWQNGIRVPVSASAARRGRGLGPIDVEADFDVPADEGGE